MIKSEENKISKKFKQKRKELKLSQEEVAKTIGVDQKTISHWENGINEPQLKRLRIFCENYDVPLSFFTDKSFIQNNNDIYRFGYYETFEHLKNSNSQTTVISKMFFSKEINENSFIIKMPDCSMDNKYNEGDFLLVEPYEKKQKLSDAVYLFEYQKDIYIRYISKNINSFLIRAENKDIPSVTLDEKDYKKLKILGRITGKIQIQAD